MAWIAASGLFWIALRIRRPGAAAWAPIAIMVPAALMLAGGAVLAFILAARDGQYDDLQTPAHRMLADDDGLTHTDRER